MFVYYNINPDGESLPDCVTRAISLATGINYYDITWMLESIGDYYSCHKLCVDCYSNLLSDVFGFDEYDGKNKKVSEIMEENPRKILLLRLDGHLVCAINGTAFDTWDCTDEKCDRYWIVER